MSAACTQLDAFLDQRLEQQALAEYEQHQQECADCASRVKHWRSLQHAGASVQDEGRLPLVTAAKAAKLVSLAWQQPTGPAWWRAPVLTAAAVCLSAALVAGVWLRSSKEWIAPMLVLDGSAQTVSAAGARSKLRVTPCCVPISGPTGLRWLRARARW